MPYCLYSFLKGVFSYFGSIDKIKQLQNMSRVNKISVAYEARSQFLELGHIYTCTCDMQASRRRNAITRLQHVIKCCKYNDIVPVNSVAQKKNPTTNATQQLHYSASNEVQIIHKPDITSCSFFWKLENGRPLE